MVIKIRNTYRWGINYSCYLITIEIKVLGSLGERQVALSGGGILWNG